MKNKQKTTKQNQSYYTTSLTRENTWWWYFQLSLLFCGGNFFSCLGPFFYKGTAHGTKNMGKVQHGPFQSLIKTCNNPVTSPMIYGLSYQYSQTFWGMVKTRHINENKWIDLYQMHENKITSLMVPSASHWTGGYFFKIWIIWSSTFHYQLSVSLKTLFKLPNFTIHIINCTN